MVAMGRIWRRTEKGGLKTKHYQGENHRAKTRGSCPSGISCRLQSETGELSGPDPADSQQPVHPVSQYGPGIRRNCADIIRQRDEFRGNSAPQTNRRARGRLREPTIRRQRIGSTPFSNAAGHSKNVANSQGRGLAHRKMDSTRGKKQLTRIRIYYPSGA